MSVCSFSIRSEEERDPVRQVDLAKYVHQRSILPRLSLLMGEALFGVSMKNTVVCTSKDLARRRQQRALADGAGISCGGHHAIPEWAHIGR